jgi:biopolymer transport protein TolQ
LQNILSILLMPDVVAGKKLTDLIADSSIFAKAVLAVLLVFSIISWAIIIFKYLEFRSLAKANDTFLKEFRRRRSLESNFAALSRISKSPLSVMLGAAFIEMESLVKTNAAPQVKVDDEGLTHIAEAIDRSGINEAMRLERNVVFLATTANASPFIGLLGTVWGIMEAFSQIGVRGTATLAVVAPGIAEALIATVAGLGAAIPAVVAYNFYTNRLRQINGEIDNFKSELFSAIKKELSQVASI